MWGDDLQVIWEQRLLRYLGKRFVWFFTADLTLKNYKRIKTRYKYVYVFKGLKKKKITGFWKEGILNLKKSGGSHEGGGQCT